MGTLTPISGPLGHSVDPSGRAYSTVHCVAMEIHTCTPPPTLHPCYFQWPRTFYSSLWNPVKHTCSEIFSSVSYLRAVWIQLGSDCVSKDKSHAPSSPLRGSKPGPSWFSFPPSMRLFQLQFCLACQSTVTRFRKFPGQDVSTFTSEQQQTG